MSDQEFERYLAILSGLLRLSANRREEIAAELRDHLEERLAELLDQGVSRHQAIITALEEFGDAAGLAGEFLHVFHRQRRRWVMRMTVRSVAVCIALCLSLMAIWPDNRIAPRVARAVAQESNDPFGSESPPKAKKGPAQKAVADPFADPAPPVQVKQAEETPVPMGDGTELAPEDNNKRTEQKLAKRMKAQYTQVSLRDVLNDVAQRYEIDVFVNHKHLDEAQKNLDEVVELQFKSISGDMLLDLVLRLAELNYTIQDGIVVVTTSDDLESMMEVRVYNCRDMIALMHEHPGSNPGTGEMGGFGGAMPGAGLGVPGMPGAANPIGDGAMPGTSSARRGMAGLGGVDQAGNPAGMSGMAMPGAVGPRAMGMSMPGMEGMGMGALGGMEMSAMGGMGMAGMSSGMGGGQGSTGQGIGELNALIEVVTNTVLPESWDEAGGPGTIEAYYGGLLIVNNNPQAHRKIDKLLKMIRDAAQQPPGSVVREK